eukprot:8404040-Lingulodinium_polyedra.AAC.1
MSAICGAMSPVHNTTSGRERLAHCFNVAHTWVGGGSASNAKLLYRIVGTHAISFNGIALRSDGNGDAAVGQN